MSDEGKQVRLESSAAEDFCYLTTTGRRTGNPHTIEIWFAIHGGRLYMMSGSGDRADWVRNLQQDPRVRVRVGQREPRAHNTYEGHARVVSARKEPELDALIRRLLAGKYQGWHDGQPLSQWAQTALPVEVQFDR